MNPRTKLFIRWWVHQLRTFDCDPAIVAMKYIINRMELNIEQRYWFCFLYANTYHLPTAWVLFNEFPDFENVPLSRIEAFSRSEKARLPYQKDQKWLRGNLGQTFQSYRENVLAEDRVSQRQYFQMGEGFAFWWSTVIRDFYKFGRYTTWFYLQSLSEVCDLALNPTSLMLDFQSSKTHRQGLCYAINDGEDTLGTAFLDSAAAEILERVSTIPELKLLPVQPDYFSMETSLCSFKKLFRRSQGRYLGYYHDRFAEDIIKADAAKWPGINWQLFWDFRTECLLPCFNAGNQAELMRENQWKMNLFLDLETFHDDSEMMGQLDAWLEVRL